LNISFKFQIPFFLLGIPILWAAGVWFGKFLSVVFRRPFLEQFGKFVAVGFLNTAIDFSILNFISSTTGITAGFTLGWVNIPGFLFAALNSYLWNKYWVFSSSAKPFVDFPKFFIVTIIGIFINSSLVIVFTTFLNFGLSSNIWLNTSKVAATAITFILNFIGYKFIAFRK
jgi:putative flippase GtrA